jgi:hypothetical protein
MGLSEFVTPRTRQGLHWLSVRKSGTVSSSHSGAIPAGNWSQTVSAADSLPGCRPPDRLMHNA